MASRYQKREKKEKLKSIFTEARAKVENYKYKSRYMYYFEYDIMRDLDSRFDYSLDELTVALESECSYCGTTIRLGLDRIDNTLGHSKLNTIVACADCNLMRGNRFSVDQFKKIAKFIRENL